MAVVTPPTMSEGEEVQHVQEGVSMHIDDRPANGRGTLYVTTHNLIWKSDGGGAPISLQWRSVLMHAVSRDQSNFSHPCMYCQVQGCQEQLGASMADDEDEGLDEDEKVNEVRLVPEDSDVLSVLFQVFSECQALHPDDVEPDEGEFMFNVEEVEEGAAMIMPSPADVDMLTRPDLNNNPDRFADAEEEG